MKIHSPPNKIYVGKSNIKGAGRGVFAKFDIKKGEIIETCPFIEIPKADKSSVKESLLVTYFFYFGKRKDRLALALGFGSLYNHSYKANASFKINPREGVIEFRALENIKKGTEIIFNYSGQKKSKVKKLPLWFEV